jgi:hypothetical protein
MDAESGLAFAGHTAMLRSQIAETDLKMPPDIPASGLKK